MQITRRSFMAGLTSTLTSTLAAPLFAVTEAHAAMTAFRPVGRAALDHGAFDALLRDHVKPDGAGYNRVDYRRLKDERGRLATYLDMLQAADPRALSRNEAYAYWINLYNAVTLDVVVQAHPVKSIKKIDLGGNGLFGSGPWKAGLVTVNGRKLSLDDIEHEIVRPLFKDPMSHYGLNCASYSCPNIASRSYTGTNVDALLRENAAAYVNHPRGLAIRKGRITASKIYSWYADDFGGEAGLKPHWMALAAPEKAGLIAMASISGYDYDWSLNGL